MNDAVQPSAQTSGEEASRSFPDDAFLGQLRPQMLKFATLQLGDVQSAEDAVQEAMVGAWRNHGRFGGRAAFKTWMFSILKHKIADALRQRSRFVDAGRLLGSEDENQDLAELFDERGFWLREEMPARWTNPEGAVHDQHFWRVFEACLENLPANQARVFMMREFVELDSREVCEEVGITVTNLNVMLYRARLRLRECLENHWFQPGELPC